MQGNTSSRMRTFQSTRRWCQCTLLFGKSVSCRSPGWTRASKSSVFWRRWPSGTLVSGPWLENFPPNTLSSVLQIHRERPREVPSSAESHHRLSLQDVSFAWRKRRKPDGRAADEHELYNGVYHSEEFPEPWRITGINSKTDNFLRDAHLFRRSQLWFDAARDAQLQVLVTGFVGINVIYCVSLLPILTYFLYTWIWKIMNWFTWWLQ